jgi:hypothetical protein
MNRRRKRAGLRVRQQKLSPTAPNVVGLIDASRRILADEKGAKAPAAVEASLRQGRKLIAGQTEMLPPIAGKKE